MDLATMERACDTTERIVEAVQPAHHELPTPCVEWSVRALLNHLVGVLSTHAAFLRDQEPDVAMDALGRPAADLLGDDPRKAYRAGVEQLLGAARAPGALERTHRTPMGEVSGAVEVGFVMMDVVVHGWDLAAATGQRFAVDDDLAREILAFVRGAIGEPMRGPHIGPEVAVGADASAMAQLVAFLGRTP